MVGKVFESEGQGVYFLSKHVLDAVIAFALAAGIIEFECNAFRQL